MIKTTYLNLFSSALLVLAFMIPVRGLTQLNANNLTQYSELDGLPGAEVHDIITDRLGYTWVGTLNGLTRFDGYEFKRFYYNPNDSGSFAGGDIQSLYENHNGQIWIGSSPGVLNMYNPATASFKQFAFSHLIKHPADLELDVQAICEDSRGRMYFGAGGYRGETVKGGLLFKDEKSDSLQSFVTPDSLTINNVFRFTKDKSGNIYFLNTRVLFKIDRDQKLSRLSVSVSSAMSKNEEHYADIQFDKDGILWIITCKARLFRVNLKDDTYELFTVPGMHFDEYYNNQILFDRYNILWMTTNKGLLRFNPQRRQFEFFENESKKQLEKQPYTSLQFDSFGTLWLGTYTNGLVKYEEKAFFTSYGYNKAEKTSITPGWNNLLYETGDGKIWVATSGTANTSGGISEFDPRSNTIRRFPFSNFMPGSWQATGMMETAPGELLLSTNTGTWLFSIKTGTVKKTVLSGVPDNVPINQFLNDSRGNLWLCTMKGLYRNNKETGVFRWYDLSGLPGADAVSNQITRAVESPKHGLWLASNNGLYLYNYSTDKIERQGFDKKKGDILLTQDVNSIYEDKEGLLWVGTWQGGLSRLNAETKKIKTYTQSDGLPSMSIQGILADPKNKALWLSTFDGLSRMDLQTSQFNNFSVADGIQGQLFADGSYLAAAAGLFAFGGSNGVTIFNPDDINKKSAPPLVFLTDLKLSGKSILPGEKSILKKPIYDTKEITLDYNQNNISFEFVAIHYANPAKNKYAYKLENYDNDWREIGNQHAAFYPNLPPGNYVFRVNAANNNGVWNEEGTRLGITVLPPWWKTTGAYIIYGLILIVIAFVLDRYLRHRLVQKERERNQVRELAQAKEIEKAYHELKTTQAQLIQSEKMASLGELTAGIAHEIQNPLNFVNNFSDVNRELLAEMTDEIRKGNYEEVRIIAEDVSGNEEKINYHGKRADAIVKGMLQHSRSNTSVKEPADINKLAEEYLRLSYHGLRAKDKTFNVTMNSNFDPGIGNVRVIPQDIGRVLLNLYNNAFYSVNEKKKVADKELPTLENLATYLPAVSVSTKKIADKIEIRVADNGGGIPRKIVDKIFQPFFTTKPTGQGTGLGLSLAYDIVKAHGGSMQVVTNEGEGSEFIISIPLNS